MVVFPPKIFCAFLCFKQIQVRISHHNAPFSLFSTFFQVFTISKELVPRVLSRVVEAVSEELSRLMQCVSSFSKNGALQVLKPFQSMSDYIPFKHAHVFLVINLMIDRGVYLVGVCVCVLMGLLI